MKRAHGWLIPNRVDGYVLTLTLVYLLAILTPVLSWKSVGLIRVSTWLGTFFYVPYFTALFCIPALIATRPWMDVLKNTPMLILAWASFPVLIFSSELNKGQPWSLIFRYAIGEFRISTLVMFAIGVFVTARMFGWLMDRMLANLCGRKLSRSRFLVVIAVTLFAIAMIGNGVRSGLFNGLQFQFPSWTLQVIYCGGFLLTTAAVSYSFSRIHNRWLALVAAGSLFFVAGAILFSAWSSGWSPINYTNEDAIKVVTLFAITFSLFAMLIRYVPARQRSTTSQPPVESASIQQSTTSQFTWPSIWSYLATGVLLSTIVFVSLFDISIIARYKGPQKLFIARQIRKIQWKRGVQTRIQSPNGSAFYVYAEFSKDVDPDYFSIFEKLPNVASFSFTLVGITPEIETAGLRKLQTTLTISDSQLSHQQLNDFMAGSRQTIILRSSITDSESPLLAATNHPPSEFHLGGLAAGEIHRFLTTIKNANAIFVNQCQLNDDDWNTIIDASEQVNVSLRFCPLPTRPETLARLNHEDMADRHLSFDITDLSNDELQNALLNTRLVMKLDRETFIEDKKQQSWDHVFAGQNAFTDIDWLIQSLVDSDSFEEDARQFHLVLDHPASDTIRQLYLPSAGLDAVERVAELTDLEFLSLDTGWLGASWEFADNTFTSKFEPLSKLTHLKELYLPEDALITDYGFLEKLGNLEVLQYDAYHVLHIKPRSSFVASSCPKLKHVILFNEPHPSLLNELGKLPSLEKLTIIDWWHAPKLKKRRAIAERLVGESVEVQFINPDERATAIPHAYLEHLERVKTDVRQNRLKKRILQPAPN